MYSISVYMGLLYYAFKITWNKEENTAIKKNLANSRSKYIFMLSLFNVTLLIF